MNARPTPRAATGTGCLGFIEGRAGSILVYFVLLPLLAILVLILPPIALPSRILAAGFTSVPKTGVLVKDPDGTTLAIPGGAVKNNSSIKISSTPEQAFVASAIGQSLPANLEAKSPLYNFTVQGESPSQATLTVPIPNDAEPYTTLDLYALYGQTWFKIPFVLNQDDQTLESDLNFIPDSVIVAQTKPQAPLIGAAIASQDPVGASASQVLVEVNPTGLSLADQGSIAGDPIFVPDTSPASPYAIVPTITNVDRQGPRLDYTENMLSDETQRATQINTLVDLAVQKLYAGYNLDYEGLTPGDEPVFTPFIRDLARALHAKQKILSVTLPVPKPVAQDEWDTAGYNWSLIGRYADEVKIPMLPDPQAYEGDNPLIDQYLQWAVGQVDRYKLQFVFSAIGRDQVGDQYSPVAYADALQLLGPVNVPQQVQAGQNVTFDLPKLRDAGGIQYHQASGLYYFKYKDDQGAEHTVWLESGDSLSKRVDLMLKYNVSGVALEDLNTKSGADPRIWTVLNQYRSLQPTVLQSNLTIVWMVDGKPAGTSSPTDPKFVWQAPDSSGNHTIDAVLSVDGGQSTVSTLQEVALNVLESTPTPAPTVRPTRAPTEVPPTQAPQVAQAQPKATQPPAPPPVAPSSFSGRNLFGYGAQLNWTNSDREMELGTLNGMGFGWAKIQVRWCDIQSGPTTADLSSLDDITARAASHGIKLLFSIVCAPNWTRADNGAGGSGPPDDPSTLANFLNGVASRYCNKGLGAIEVWNEENLLTEWHGKPISAAMYVNMLRASYTSIHQGCSNIVVVSGAPTPTGVNNSTAIDDQTYLQQMYAAGLATACDAVGAHPSGFNNPPNANWQTWQDPQRPNFKGHPSFFFSGTMVGYRNIMVANGDGGKQIWPTEFGWGSTPSPFPGYEYEAQVSETDQANWLVQAYQMMKGWGWVGVATLWNLDFTNMGNETGAFHILGRPAQSALTGMPK